MQRGARTSSVDSIVSLISARSGHGTCRHTSLATTPGCNAYVVTPLPARRRASSALNSTLASFDTLYSGNPERVAVGRRSAAQSRPRAR